MFASDLPLVGNPVEQRSADGRGREVSDPAGDAPKFLGVVDKRPRRFVVGDLPGLPVQFRTLVLVEGALALLDSCKNSVLASAAVLLVLNPSVSKPTQS